MLYACLSLQDVASKKVFISCDERPADPFGQFRWARKELESAFRKGERVIIAGHVPPGNKVGANNFCQKHLEDFESLTRDFAQIIEASRPYEMSSKKKTGQLVKSMNFTLDTKYKLHITYI